MMYIITMIRVKGVVYFVAYNPQNDSLYNSLSDQIIRELNVKPEEVEILSMSLGRGGKTDYRFGPHGVYCANGRYSSSAYDYSEMILSPAVRDGIPVLELVDQSVEIDLVPEVVQQHPKSFSINVYDIHYKCINNLPPGIELLVLNPYTEEQVQRVLHRQYRQGIYLMIHGG